MRYKLLEFSDYKKLMKFSYNQMCDFLRISQERTIEEVKKDFAKLAAEEARKQLLGDADEYYILDEDEVRKRVTSIRGISDRLATEIIKVLEG